MHIFFSAALPKFCRVSCCLSFGPTQPNNFTTAVLLHVTCRVTHTFVQRQPHIRTVVGLKELSAAFFSMNHTEEKQRQILLFEYAILSHGYPIIIVVGQPTFATWTLSPLSFTYGKGIRKPPLYFRLSAVFFVS